LLVNFTELEKEISLNISNKDIVKICGNMTKHSIQHLSIIQKQLRNILSDNEANTYGFDVRLLMNDFYSRFNTDYLLRYSTNIVKMLNDIRMYINFYLLPEYKNSIKKDSDIPQKYSYIIPSIIND